MRNEFASGVVVGVTTLCLTAPLIPFEARADEQTTPPPSTSSTSAPALDASTSLQEVIVTANRRAERNENVPISVTAATAETLQAAGITSTADLSELTPGLVVNVSNGWVEPFIRGVGTTANSTGLSSPVAIYVDGVYYAAPTGTLFSFNNIDSVEVDRGPQGTLFGRNATGGVIQVNTRTPSQTPSIEAEVGAANYRTWKGNVYATGGLTETLAADVAVQYTKQDEGYGVNRYPGNGQDVYNGREVNVRTKWLWRPSDADRVTLAADYGETKSSAPVAIRFASGTTPFGYPVTPAFTSSNPWDVDSLVQPAEIQRQEGASLKIEHDFAFATFSSLSAYRQEHNSQIFDFGYPPFEIGADEHDLNRQITQEFQLSSASSSIIKWTAGLFYLNGHASSDPYRVFGTLLPEPNVYSATTVTNSGALYGQATAPVATATNLTVGVRYTFEKSELYGTSLGEVIPKASQHFGKGTWRIALDHHFTDELMSYVSYSRGFRAGTYNATQPTQPAIAPESLDAYEVGSKATLLEDRVHLDASAFYYKYNDIQVPIYNPAGIYVLNAAKAKLYGVDFDSAIKPFRNFTLNAGVEWLHTQFLSFKDAPFNTPLTEFPFGNCPTCSGSAAGHQMPVAPDFTGTARASYVIPMGGAGDLDLNADDAYNSGWWAGPDNIARQRAYNLVNALAGWTSPDTHLRVQVWVHNIANTAAASRLASLFSGDIETLLPPRTYGVDIKYTLGGK
jgi:iron complex outermembrane recepter protein